MARYEGKVAIVTGSASGIGAACLKRLVAEGAKVICADINDELGAQTVAELGENARFFHCDVGDLEQVQALVQFAVDEFGGLDVMVNNAVYSGGGWVHEIDPTEWDKSIQVSMTSVFYGCKAALPVMIARGGGAIVNTASIEGYGAEMMASPYCTAKAGVINFTKCVAVEYGRQNIRANTFCPGIVETPLLESMIEYAPRSREEMEELSPMGRFMQPEDMAAVVAFLASDDARAITGESIVADAGITSMINLSGRKPLGA